MIPLMLAAIMTAQATIINIGASNPNPDPQTIAAGEAQGGKLFLAQAGRNGANLTGAPSVTVTIRGQTISATASYNAAVASNFGRIAGVDTLAVQGAATASLHGCMAGRFCLSLSLVWRICHTALENALKQSDCNDSQLTRSVDDSDDCLGAEWADGPRNFR